MYHVKVPTDQLIMVLDIRLLVGVSSYLRSGMENTHLTMLEHG